MANWFRLGGQIVIAKNIMRQKCLLLTLESEFKKIEAVYETGTLFPHWFSFGNRRNAAKSQKAI